MSLPVLPQDKANHFVYGAVIMALSALVVQPLQALAIVGAFAVLKEGVDWCLKRKGGKHGVEVLDILATVAGGVVCLLPLIK